MTAFCQRNAPMREPRLRSLSFSLVPADAARLEALIDADNPPPGQPRGRTRAETVADVWFDTADNALRARGLCLRIAASRGKFWQIARRWPGETASPEWPDIPVKTPLPDLATLPSAFTRHIGDEALAPVFEAAIERHGRAPMAARPAAGVMIDISLDRGFLAVGDARIEIRESRLEMIGGRPADLFAVARACTARARMRIEFASRAERGYRLREGTWGQPVGRIDSRIRDDMNTVEAFGEIARDCLLQFSLNQPAFNDAHAVEAVHQTRVAIRRLRSAMSLFAPILRDETFERLRGELKWLFACLGEARDLDVHVEFLRAQTNGAREGLAEMETRRREAHDRLATALASERVDALLLDLAEWIETGAWRRSRDPGQTRERGRSIADFAARRLAKRHKPFVRLAARFDDLTAEQAHALRLDTKKLRYMAEFLEPLARDRKARKRYETTARTLARLQESLGDLHDLDLRLAAARQRAIADIGLGLVGSHVNEAIAADMIARDDLLREASREARAAMREKPFWTLI